MIVRSYTDVRNNLKAVLDEANDDRVPILVTRRSGGNAVIVAEAEWNSITETLHLLGSRANAEALFASIDELDAGKVVIYDPAQDPAHREAA